MGIDQDRITVVNIEAMAGELYFADDLTRHGVDIFVGIETEISNLEWAQWLEEVFRGKDYGLTIVSHTEPFDIGIYARPDYYFQYDNPEFQQLITDLTAETDPAARSELISTAQTTISNDYVNGYLFQLAVPTVVKTGVKGIWPDAPTQAVDLTGVSWTK